MASRIATLTLALAVSALCALPFGRAAAQAGAPKPPAPKEADRTTLEADVIEGVSDLEVTARGNAEIRRDDLTIFGEEIRYNRELGRAEADGGVRLQRGPDRLSGQHLEYNTLDDTGLFEKPSYLLQRDRVARGSAERIELLGRDRYHLTDATFTTCEPGKEDWVVQASEIELDYEEEEGRATHPRVRFFDTTILAAPWAVFPIGGRRKSGLLAPYYSQTSQRGFEIGMPYYWNIAPEYDLTLTPIAMSRRGFQLKNQLRYLQRPYAGELRFEYLPDDKEFGTSREGVSWQHAQTFYPGLTGQVDYNKVSDDRYFVDLASQVKQVSVSNLPQDANVTQIGSTLGGRLPFSGQLRVQRFQTLQDPLAPIVPPYHRMPQVNLAAGYNELGGLLDTGLPIEYVNFTHPTLVQGSRTSLNPSIAAPLLRPGWFVTPKAGVRLVGYGLDRADPGAPQAPQVSIPWFTFDSGLVFDRPSDLFGAGSTQTLEPRLFYVYVPYRNQDSIPIFDTALADYNYAQLFTENRFVGGDRFGDAKQLTVAITSRFLQVDGQEVLRLALGQRYYFAAERVGLTPTSELRSTSDSDLLASIGGRIGRRWSAEAATQYDRYEQRAQRFNTAVRYTPEPAKVINFSYRFDRADLKQIDVSTQWPIAAGWYGVGRYNYSFLDKRLVEGLAGFEFNAGCWVFRAVGQRLQASTQVATTAFVFQLEFNGIGAIGTAEATELLKRSVPGYSVTNPMNTQLAPSGTRPQLPFEQTY